MSSNGVNSNRELCKYYMHGICRFGNSCFFSHNQPSSNAQQTAATSSTATTTPTTVPNNICKYFLAGRCMFGENCFNQHVIPSQSSTSDEVEHENDDYDEEEEDAEEEEVKPKSESYSGLVRRILNKPRLVTTNLTDQTLNGAEKDSAESSSNSAEEATFTPASYYEALTGKKLDYDELNDVDLNLFDQDYIDYVKRRKQLNEQQQRAKSTASAVSSNSQLCPYFEKQLVCPFEQSCEYVHGAVCDLCNCACLNPLDEKQQQEHRKECMKNIENEMEEAFATQCSKEKLCGICMEIVWEKENTADRRFGILENCNHIYCLGCIRKWRASKSYENKVVKACPECRVKSDYVTPSKFWFDNEDNKKRIIQDYKSKLGKTDCKYFKQGEGSCPFGNKCFYLHRYKDGRLATLPEPTRRRRLNRQGDLEIFSNFVRIDFNIGHDDDYDDDDDEFDIFDFLRPNFPWDTETESDISELFELSSEFLNLM